MTQSDIGNHIGGREEGVGMKKAEGARLDRASEIQGVFLNRFRERFNNQIADPALHRAIQHKPKGALGIVLADEDHAPVKERSSKFSTVQEQLTL